MAHRLSQIAMSLGHKTAKCWANDRGLMQFLVIQNLSVLGK
jgi:hypothetical protein